MNNQNLKFLDQLFPESGGEAFINDWWLKRYTLQHGDVSRLPACLQAPDGAIAGIHCLENWRKGDLFDVAVVDDIDYTQYTVRDLPPMALYRVGAPVMLSNPHYRINELAVWVTGVSSELGIANEFVTVNAWFARKSYGLGMHYDPGEVILIQLVGNKRIQICTNQFTTVPDTQYELCKPCEQSELPLFVNGFPEGELEGAEEIELYPGSVLAMPRGTWHNSLAMDSESIALALFFRTPTVVSLVTSYLRECLRQDPLWRTPLFGLKLEGDNSTNIQGAMDTISASLQTLDKYIQAIHPEQVIAHAEPVISRIHRLKQAPYSLQRLPEASLSIKATNSDACQIVIHARLDMQQTKTSEMELDSSVVGALEWISEHPARFTIKEISSACPELPLDHIEGLIDVLLETNYLALLPFPSIQPDDGFSSSVGEQN